ncbi:MAG: proton-conducting transporter membrane subunit, partial [Elusimicrobia bacterium]|nr:proton-conducting transporter membrane subunit [Elusimicrobiota bacterium]
MRYSALLQASPALAEWGGGLLRLLGLISILVAAVFILFQHDGKRLLAYHSVEHLGIIALGLGLGGLGRFAALFHALNHSLCKSTGFFCMGRLGRLYGSNDLRRISGAAQSDRVWGGGLFFSFLALLGAAPFAIFLSELLIVKAALDQGAYAALLVFLAGTSIIFVSALRHAIGAALGEPPPGLRSEGKTGPAEAAVVLAPLAALLVMGLWMPEPLRAVLERAAAILGGRP